MAQRMIEQPTAVGGHSLGDICRRLFATVASNSMFELYSLKGRKGKLNFIDTAMMPVVIKAMKAQQLNETMTELEDTIAETLKHAPKRKGATNIKSLLRPLPPLCHPNPWNKIWNQHPAQTVN